MNTKLVAISIGWAGRFHAVAAPKWRTWPLSSVAGMSGVHTGPGATQLTRMPRSASALASDCVNVCSAPLVAA